MREEPRAPTSPGLRMRGPFEPANNLTPPSEEEPTRAPSALAAPSSSDSPPSPRSSPSPPLADSGPGKPMSQAARASMWSPTAAKMDQIKDLYLTAEAIGEDALDQHFQLVSERQRQLIREYFDEPVTGNADGLD